MQSLSYLFLTFFLLQTAPGQEAQSSKIDASSSSYRTGKIAAGTDWETDFYIADSGRSGPTVLVVGGMHGNEPAGSRAAEQIRHWPIVSGKLVVIPKANVLALTAKTRLTPGQPENAGNLNRNFPEIQSDDKNRVKPRGELAAALWRFATKIKPDWVLDLHEGYDFHRSHTPKDGEKKSVGSSVIYLGSKTMDPIAERMIAAANATVTAPEKRFSLLRRGPVLNGLARSCINVMGAEALILETTFKEQPMSLRTRQHRVMANVLLNHIGLISSDCSNRTGSPKNNTDPLHVELYDGEETQAAP